MAQSVEKSAPSEAEAEVQNDVVKDTEKLSEKEAENTQASTASSSLNSKVETIKIRKRKADFISDAPSKPTFSLRNRSEQEDRRQRSSTPELHTSSFSKKPTVKPSWIKDDELSIVAGTNQPLPNPNDDPQELTIEEQIALKRQDLDRVVRDHYNQRTYASRQLKRNDSPIIKLRNYNNVIKFMLINNSTQPGQRVLDLGCGKGGDINKWARANISEYIGIDISNASINEAIKRYRNSRAQFQVTFVTGDCFGKYIPEVLVNFPYLEFPVDVVSMQFCLHYAFETEQKARTMIENVSRSLRTGGVFLGTIPNSDFIRSKIKSSSPGTKSFGNSVYSVTFENDVPEDGYFPQPYGNVYNYFLQDAIDNVPEYVVPFDSFRSLAEEYGLKLQYKKTFSELFKENIPAWYKRLSPKMIEGIKRRDGTLGIQGDEAEAADFYLAFSFVKI